MTLVFNEYDHYRMLHGENEFARSKGHMNGIENFWNFANGRLMKFHGQLEKNFVLHRKECE